MMPTNWLIYAGLLGVIFFFLSSRVIRGRKAHRVPFGDGGVQDFQLIVRAHGNFAEYVPLALILLMGVDLLQWPIWLVHTLGILLVIARVTHVLALRSNVTRGRIFGTATTWGIILVSSILVLIRALPF